jgi:hypothetical protein
MPRITDEGLSCAQLALGETVIDPARWPKVMEHICSVAGATGALLLQTDIRTPARAPDQAPAHCGWPRPPMLLHVRRLDAQRAAHFENGRPAKLVEGQSRG